MPTALELGRAGWQPYIEAARQQQSIRPLTRAEQEVYRQLLDRIREAATALKDRFKARRVILFGSLAHAAWFVPNSDVDLAVEGLQDNDYWQAWRLVEEIIGGRSVDLIQVEMAGESLKRAIQRYGVEL